MTTVLFFNFQVQIHFGKIVLDVNRPSLSTDTDHVINSVHVVTIQEASHSIGKYPIHFYTKAFLYEGPLIVILCTSSLCSWSCSNPLVMITERHLTIVFHNCDRQF